MPKEIYILFIGKIVNCLGAFVHPLMSLILTQKIGMSPIEAGKFVTLLSVCQVPCIILGGKLADTIGRKKVIVTFQILGAITLFLCGIIPLSINTAYLMIVSSCFYSISTPAYDAINADITTKENRKASYSLLYMGVNIGFSIGPILGGFLYENYLSFIFIGDAITTLIALTLLIVFIKEDNIAKNNENIEVDKSEEIVQGSVFTVLKERPILIIFPFIILMYQFAYGQWGFTVPIKMGDIFGNDGAKMYGMLGGLNGFIVILGTPILTSLTKKYNILNVMGIGGLLYGVCFVILGMFNTFSFMVLAVFLLTIGEILISINSSTFIANNTPSSHRGRISSLIPMISGAGYAFGPMIMGQIIEFNGMMISCIIVSVVASIGGLLMFSLKRLQSKTSQNDMILQDTK